MTLRTLHRAVTVVVVLFTAYLGVTGTLIQLIDLRSIFTHASPLDANVMAMREAFDGPGDYQVIMPQDYLAPVLPRGADLQGMLARVGRAARSAAGPASIRYEELRMAGGRPVGQAWIGNGLYRFDASTGAALPIPPTPPDNSQHPASDRNTVKELHRMTSFGDWALWINIVVSAALATLIVTGVAIYAKMLAGRLKLGRTNPFWSAGGGWRALHRSISILAASFLVVVILSGAWLAVESLGLAINMAAAHRPGAPPPRVAAAPLKDDELGRMLQVTLGAYDKANPGAGLRVVRLRHYGDMAQGAVVTGEQTARQLVYDAMTGRQVSETEPGYPPVGFPFGWQAHQIAKHIHRGDYIGMPGRFMDLLAGLSLIYLSVSGVVMYWRMWRRRCELGRRGLIWS